MIMKIQINILKVIIFFSFLIINSQMSGLPVKNQKGVEIPLVSRQSHFEKEMQLLGILSRKSSDRNDIFQDFGNQHLALPRLESQGNNGNIFRGFNQEEPDRPIPQLTLAQMYALQCLQYEKYLFDEQIKLIIRRMAIRAYNLFRSEKDSPFFAFPIQKLLAIIAKKLLLNRFQLLFLQYAFQITKWKYDLDCIKKHSNHFNSYFLNQDAQMPIKELSYMELYLLYCAYYSKKSLNELPPDNIFNEFLLKVCPKFKQFFPEWNQRSNVATKINPKMLNNIFKRLTFYTDREREQVENYSLIVEEIIDISPSYNSDKNSKKKKQTKRKKKQPKPEYSPILQNQSHSGYNLPKFEHDFELDEIPALRNKKSSFLSNVDALQPRHYLTRSLSNE